MAKAQTYKGKTALKGGRLYVWCSFMQKYLPERMFSKNSAGPDGYQRECKVVNRMRGSNSSLGEVVSTLPKKEQKMFA